MICRSDAEVAALWSSAYSPVEAAAAASTGTACSSRSNARPGRRPRQSGNPLKATPDEAPPQNPLARVWEAARRGACCAGRPTRRSPRFPTKASRRKLRSVRDSSSPGCRCRRVANPKRTSRQAMLRWD